MTNATTDTTAALVTSAAVLARFNAKIRVCPDTGCHEWTGALTKPSDSHVGGYGRFRVGRVVINAHRFALMSALGRELLPGHEADHLCHNRRCVNRAHLREIPKADNIREMNTRRAVSRRQRLALAS